MPVEFISGIQFDNQEERMVNLDQKGSDGMSYYVKIYEDVLRCRGWNSSQKYQLCERKSEESLPTGDGTYAVRC